MYSEFTGVEMRRWILGGGNRKMAVREYQRWNACLQLLCFPRKISKTDIWWWNVLSKLSLVVEGTK
jgi:hypothetical protein